MTSGDLKRTPRPIEGGGYELDEGGLVYVSPNSLERWDVIHKVYHLLKKFADSRQLGLVIADACV